MFWFWNLSLHITQPDYSLSTSQNLAGFEHVLTWALGISKQDLLWKIHLFSICWRRISVCHETHCIMIQERLWMVFWLLCLHSHSCWISILVSFHIKQFPNPVYSYEEQVDSKPVTAATTEWKQIGCAEFNCTTTDSFSVTFYIP